MKARKLGSLMVAGVLLGGAAACGSGETEPQVVATAAYLADSAERTSEDTGQFSGEMRLEIEVPPEVASQVSDPVYIFEFSAEGEYDAPAELVAFDSRTRYEGLNFPEGGWSGNGHGVEDGDTIYLNRFPYSGWGGFFEVSDKAWVVIDLPPQPADTLTQDQDDAVGQVASPSQSLDLLRERLVDVEEVGPDRVRGVATTRLSARYPLPQEAADRLEAAGLGGEPVAEVDVWVDDGGRVRRIDTQLEMDRHRASSTFEYFDFGAEVDIEVPTGGRPLEDLVLLNPFPVDDPVGPPAGPSLDGVTDIPSLEAHLETLTPTERYEFSCDVFAENPALQEECNVYMDPGGWDPDAIGAD